jgi:Cof subfamily protein (haloacid dehalogenase superfamily)
MLLRNQSGNPPVIALDLDGTVLQDDKSVSAFTVETLQILSRNGLPVFFVTGRDRRIAQNVIPFVDFPSWIILNNGVSAKCLPGWEKVYTHHIPASLRNVVLKSLAEIERYPLFIVEQSGSPVDRVLDARLLDDTVYREYAERHGDCIVIEPDIAASSLLDRALAMCLCEPNECVEEVRSHLTGVLGESIEHRSLDNLNFLPTHTVIEIIEPGWTKSDGIHKLKKILGIEDRIVYAFGDDHNDIDMLVHADRSFAVETAIDAARNAADEIIPSNNDDGVARILRMLFEELF